MFFCSCDFIFNFFAIFSKNSLQYIDPSGHFVFYEILCSSNFLGQMSPWCCSRGSPGGWIKISFFTKLVDIYHRKIHWKNYDDCFINEGDIQRFELWKKKKKRNREVSKMFNFGNLKMFDGTVWHVKRCAFKRRFHKYVTLINRFIRSTVMVETLKLKKRGFGFLIIKGQFSIFFKNGKKLHILQLHTFSVYELQ